MMGRVRLKSVRCPGLTLRDLAAKAALTAAWREALEDMKRCVRVCFPAGGWWPFGCNETTTVSRE